MLPQEIAVTDLATVKDNVSATSLLIQWEVPREHNPSFYVVFYQAIKIASVAVTKAMLHSFLLNGKSTMTQITGLESYTTYNVTVTPISTGGVCMKSKTIFAGMLALINGYWFPPRSIIVSEPHLIYNK